MNKETGEPAFPTWDGPNSPLQGMALRDYFAAQAMQGLVLMSSIRLVYGSTTYTETATKAYEIADAMIKKREK